MESDGEASEDEDGEQGASEVGYGERDDVAEAMLKFFSSDSLKEVPNRVCSAILSKKRVGFPTFSGPTKAKKN